MANNSSLNIADFEAAYKEGHLLKDTLGDLVLYNYTKETQYARNWNNITRSARGIVFNQVTGEIVARPISKFHNLLEPLSHDGTLAQVQPGEYEIYEKLDGSLGIGFQHEGTYRWCTRGAFNSPQAKAANAIWERKYAHKNEVVTWIFNFTLCAEIIHPSSKVICKYDYEDLVLLTARDRFSGQEVDYGILTLIAESLKMPLVKRLAHQDVESLIKHAETLGIESEGFVLKWPDGYRLKIKGEAYRRLHRMLECVTPKQVAIDWHDGLINQILHEIPEEFRADAEGYVKALNDNLATLKQSLDDTYAIAPVGVTQKEYAAWVKQQEPTLQALLFLKRPRAPEVDLVAEARVRSVNLQMRKQVRDSFIVANKH